ncbi:MAG: MFS transporter [Woeseiaceae bacterium]|nr:MFS transporter [Woeseiaceae bacterium]
MSGLAFVDRKVLAWAFYDWANSAFALSVLAVLFPLFLGSYWNVGASGADVTARLAWITSGTSALICILSPIFGTIADAGGYRKRFLFILATLGALSTAALGFVDEGLWPWALAFYGLGLIGYYGSMIFYDSLIVDVTAPRFYSAVSAMGFAVGYLGGAVLLGLHVFMLMDPSRFGFDTANDVIRFAFITVGAWWAIFALPILALVPESKAQLKVVGGVVRTAFSELKSTIIAVGQYRNVVLFLVAYCLYIGGVFTVIFMAVNYGQRLGFSQQDLVMALLITNFVGFPATLIHGYFGHRFGPRKGLYFALSVYVIVSTLAVFMTDVREFYAMAIVVGCVQGGVQGLSRSFFATLIPSGQPGEFFGFYNMVTKFSHVVGPALVGVAATFSDAPEWVLLVLIPLFVVGGGLLAMVQSPARR